ncbi:MAG: putative quinol monooxygenase [Bryobacteraceae bacterium]|jgi:quinol monooxygenase YgiN
MRVRVVAHITARPETIPAVREVLLGFIEPTRKEAGCIFYELLQDNTDPCQFTFVEEWTSDEALDIHLRTPHLTAGVSRLSTLIAEPLDVRRCTLIA